MSAPTVTYTFQNAATIVAAEHNTNFSDLVTYITNRNSGSTPWDALAVTSGTTILTNSGGVPLTVNNSTGTDDIIRLQDNSTTLFSIADGGTYSIAGTWDGWIGANQTWTYASATTITVPSGAASKYQVGDKIKITQTTAKYFYIVAVADTLLTVAGGSDYSVANAAITSPFYSKMASPHGFPGWFNFTPVWGSFAADPTGGNAKFCINGRAVTVKYDSWSSATSNATSFNITGPVTASVGTIGQTAIGLDNSAFLTQPARVDIAAGSAIFTCYTKADTTLWTGIGTKNIFFTITYQV
jgi:hypothetical protein